MSAPSLPEGADSFAEENYRIAALRSFQVIRNHVMDLLGTAGEFDLLNEAWVNTITDLADKYAAEVEYFSRLNPPDEYADQHAKLVESMRKIADQMELFDSSMREGTFTEGADALTAIQTEANTLVASGRFDDPAYIAPTTVAGP